ncbi:putative membrane-associated serine protease [Terrabacter tumescens]|uniref:Membrane-associated serine protease n=1 Tax=Terrabacter tumescens TaxID=60443 RepID=A0ABQ2IKT8_9MICO|nr:MarP family serine protease [Terrabacter tumescens]GGN09825.1 putative membrane-associated serine protease [Terrabacter tumescens]
MSGSVLLDIALVLLLLAYGYSGYRSGLIQSVFSLVGFFAFAMLGVWQLPELLVRWQSVADDDRTRVLVLLLGVVVLGWIGQYLGSLLGSRIRRRMGQTSLRHVDSVLGAVVVTLAASLIIWFIGGALRTAGSPALSKAMAESKVLQVVNSVVPEETGQVFASFRGFLSSQGFPQVFGGLAPEPITPVQDPDPAVAQSQAIRSAGRSVVKVTTQSQSCQRGQEGTGWVLSPGRIVTNAHVVAGADEVRVQGGDQVLRARVVVFDSRRDLAVLSVPGLLLPPLPLGGELKRGDSAAVPGYPLDGPYRVVSARVRAQLDARGLDIYGRERVVREIYSLAATVQPGNSGGPLLDTNGQVVGVIFAKSLEDDSTGYALTLAEAKPVLDEAAAAGAEVDTGACVAG